MVDVVVVVVVGPIVLWILVAKNKIMSRMFPSPK